LASDNGSSSWGERFHRALDRLQDGSREVGRFFRERRFPGGKGVTSIAAAVLVLVLVVPFGLSLWWGIPPERFDPVANAQQVAEQRGQVTEGELPAGYVSAATLDHMVSVLLDKPGGYLHNDILPPGVLMDNIPAFEQGMVIQIRDFAETLRDDMARSQTQSAEDPDLAVADPQFAYNYNKWGVLFIPSTEGEYRKGQEAVQSYMRRLADKENPNDGQFYVRADNLRDWLKTVEMRLGDYAQNLSAARPEIRMQTNLGGEPAGTQAKPESPQQAAATPWLEIDDVWWQARGGSYALLHFMQAVRHDFRPVLEDKNALPRINQIIQELRYALREKDAWMILNGEPFGLLPNHSLVMSSYMARANAAVIDLRELLQQG